MPKQRTSRTTKPTVTMMPDSNLRMSNLQSNATKPRNRHKKLFEFLIRIIDGGAYRFAVEKRRRSSTNPTTTVKRLYLLSLTDNIVTSARSTFGYVAHSLGGLKPWLLYQPARGKTPDPPCVRAVSMEPCFLTPPTHGCEAKKRINSAKVVPFLPDNLPQIRRKSIATISLSSAVRSPSALPSNFSVWKQRSWLLVQRRWKYQRSLKIRNYSGVLTQEPGQFHNFGRPNDCGTVQEDEVVVNSSSFGGAVKQEHEHVDEECSRKRTGSCVRPGGTKACSERLRREKLNEKFMDLSSVLEPGRTPKTDKPDKLLEEIKSLKAEKNELREEKPALKAEKEKTEQQLKSMCSLKLLLELNRALRPGGFFVWSATAVYRKTRKILVYGKVKTTCGKHCRFHVERGRNIGYVKKQIWKQKGGDFVDSEILYEGEKLEDQSLINDICRNGDSVLHLLVRRSAKVRAKPVDKSFELSIVALPQASVVTQRKQFSLEPLIVNPKVKLSPVVKDMISSASDMLRSGNPPVRSREGT
ncbi:hypothetical protein Bca52824_027053 [Brassica carinata]|uniref:Fucosyltransferase n=1 Tax=Brassica carinata TaxID=52824 RepID=A0A8X7V8I3_BRACI|nr:hypothetical protein Bca52824_027053 [Brassica carinata]